MQKLTKSVVKGVARRLGYDVHRVGLTNPGWEVHPESVIDTVTSERYVSLVSQLHGALSELLFVQLPPVDGRSELLAKLVGTPVSEAMYVVACLHEAMSSDGDVCEFGVAQGATSALLANEIRGTSKRLWLFDSFGGLPPPTDKDILIDDIFGLGSMEKYAGTMACPLDMVTTRLAAIDFSMSRVEIVAGFVDKAIQSGRFPQKVSFAYVDFDFYEPILITLRALSSRLGPTGVIVVDDYGFFSAGAKTAVEEFLQETGGAFTLSLPKKFAEKAAPFCMLRRTQAR